MSVIVKNRVLLLKAEINESGTDKYASVLREHNFDVIIVKTLDFVYMNLEVLKDKLLKADDYTGLILSSPRCVSAAHQILPKDQLQRLWFNKLNFTVGESTYLEAYNKLGVRCEGKESGNAKNLSTIILREKDKIVKPFLFPHGNLKTDTLKLELNKERLEIEGVLVYETLPNCRIEKDLRAATDDYAKMPEIVVFFSPSGLNSSLEHLQRSSVDLNLLKFVAIGPVTKSAIESVNLKVWSVAASPTPEEVLNAIQL